MEKIFVYILTYNFIDRGTLKEMPCRQVFAERNKADQRFDWLKASLSHSNVEMCLSELLF